MKQLKKMPAQAQLDDAIRGQLRERMKPRTEMPEVVNVDRSSSATPGHDLVITAAADEPSEPKWARLRYRHLTQFEDYRPADMSWDPQQKVDGAWPLVYNGITARS